MLNINGSSKITGIFGFPVQHTLSPAMQNSAYAFLKLNYVYIPFEIHPCDLKNAVNSLRFLNIIGVNVTVPHKENIIPYLDTITEDSKKIGAVNLVYNISGSLQGDNTDWKGFLEHIKIDSKLVIKNKNCFVIGAGGAAAAIIYGLKKEKAKKIFVCDIMNIKANNTANKFEINFIKYGDQNIKKIIKSCDLIINATTVGMKKEDNNFPVNPEYINKNQFIYDVVYNRETELMKYCKKNKIKHSNGLGMLLYQGAITFEILTGKVAPVKIMKEALLKNMGEI